MRLRKNIAISESGFVFDPNTGDSFSLNRIGLEIIEMLKQGKTDREIIHILLEKYETDSASLDRYYSDFLATLKHCQLIDPDEEN